MSQRRNRLSDPAYAAFAWARYRRIMRWVVLVSILSVVAAILYLRADGSPLTAAALIATTAGVVFSVLLAGALMGLIFLSSGTGHDEDVAHLDKPGDEQPGDWLDKKRRP